MSQLGPHGLAHKDYGTFQRDLTVNLVGAQSNAAAGVVSAQSTGEQQTTHLGPHGLTSKARQFSPKQAPNQDVNASVTGAQIELQAAFPDSANANIYVDGIGSTGDAGSVQSSEAFSEGAEIAGEAGTATVRVDAATAITGAQIAAQDGDIDAGAGTFASVVGSESVGNAGTPSAETDVNVSISGAQTNAQGAEVGTDTDSPVSVTVTGASTLGEAGTVDSGPNVTVNISGVAILGGAGSVSHEFIPSVEIVNTTATTNVPHNVEQDPKSGFKQWPGDLIRDGYGDYTRRKSYDPRNPQEFVRSKQDKQVGSPSPEGEDVFLADGEVTAEDL